ncbi:uncharacterized protein [Solanum lycopersicum]|uniref:uncharacterized protein n=1 Tax=Solanum lycopersicum TaxID=4081 RepID=UPI00374A7ED7
MLGILEGIAQAGALPVSSDGSQTRVGGQTPDPIVAPSFDSMEFPDMTSHLMTGSANQWWRDYISSRPVGSHPLSWTQFTQVFLSKFFPRSERERKRAQFEGLQQNGMSVAEYEGKFHALARNASMILPTEDERVRRFVKGLIIPIRLGVSQVADSSVPFQNVVDAAKELEMIRREDLSSETVRGLVIQVIMVVLRLEVGVTWAEGSYSRPVVRGGHFGHSGFSHQPASRRGCFECGDMGHFVRDCPRTRRGGLHQGSQALTSRVAQPPARGGEQNGRGGSHSGRGGSPSGRGGGREGSQIDGGRSHCYAFPGRSEAKASDAVITGIIPICHRPATVLFDQGSTYSYVYTYFAPSLDILCESRDLPIRVSTPVGDSVVVDRVY